MSARWWWPFATHSSRITTLEEQMSNASEQIDAITGRFEDFVNDVNAELNILREHAGNLDVEAQGALDRLSAKLQAADAVIGDADGSEAIDPAQQEPDPAQIAASDFPDSGGADGGITGSVSGSGYAEDPASGDTGVSGGQERPNY